MVRLDFNADGQFPYEECTDLVRNVTDEAAEDVIDGCWIGDTTRGLARLYYAGNLPAVATTDQALPMSINVRLRFVSPVEKNRGMWIRFTGPSGSLFLCFRSDGETRNQVGTTHNAQHEQIEYAETGVSFREFHTFTFVWNPASKVPEGDLLIDGTPLGQAGLVDESVKSEDGYVEFGCQIADGSGPAWEMDFIRFGNDNELIKED